MKIQYIAFIFTVFLLTGCGSSEDASRITLAPANTIISLNDLQYQDPFVLQITDVNGNPAPSSQVTITLVPTRYIKGSYIAQDTSSPADGTLDEWVSVSNIICQTEDVNNNGFLEAGEDINNNASLEPTNPATVTAHPNLTPTFSGIDGSLITDENGFGYFVLTYPKSEGNWVTVKLTASTSVSGTESTETYEYTLPVADADVSNIDISPPGGVTGKYGSAADCTNPN